MAAGSGLAVPVVLAIPRPTPIKAHYDSLLLNGVEILEGKAIEVTSDSLGNRLEKTVPFKAIPYYAWNNRQIGQMVVWTPEKPERISSVEVYWLAFDHYDVLYRAPESWKLWYKDNDNWKEVEATSPYGTKIDCYNKLTFKPIVTQELKLVVQLRRQLASATMVPSGQPDETGPQLIEIARHGYSGGIIEWKVNP
jgi:hypothetical protein